MFFPPLTSISCVSACQVAAVCQVEAHWGRHELQTQVRHESGGRDGQKANESLKSGYEGSSRPGCSGTEWLIGRFQVRLQLLNRNVSVEGLMLKTGRVSALRMCQVASASQMYLTFQKVDIAADVFLGCPFLWHLKSVCLLLWVAVWKLDECWKN